MLNLELIEDAKPLLIKAATSFVGGKLVA